MLDFCFQVIVCESASGWLLNHLAALQICNACAEQEVSVCSDCTLDSINVYNSHPDLFAIEEPYRMDSQYKKLSQKSDVLKKKKVWNSVNEK